MSEDDGIDDAQLDALFRALPAEFVARRKELATELKRGGDKRAAERVTAIRKPTPPAWIANQLYHAERGAWEQTMGAGAQLRAAQEGGGLSVADMQQRVLAQRRAVQRLVGLAEELAGELGVALNRGHLRALQDTLEAFSLGSHEAAGARPGRLTQELAAPSFDALDAARVLAARPPAGPSAAAASGIAPSPAAPGESTAASVAPRPPRDPAALVEARMRLQRARLRRDELRPLAEAARQKQRDAAVAFDRAKAELAAAELRVATARERLEKCENGLAEAQAVARSRADQLAGAEGEVAAAERDAL